MQIMTPDDTIRKTDKHNGHDATQRTGNNAATHQRISQHKGEKVSIQATSGSNTPEQRKQKWK